MPDARLDLAPAMLMDDLERLADSLHSAPPALVLIGRRHVRSNNSWMHNLATLQGGKRRCTLLVHPEDAARHGLADGASVRVRSRVGSLVAPVEITDDMRPGVVSLPHGWGHDEAGANLRRAASDPGVNTNLLTDDLELDPLSGTSVLNGIPVEITAADV